MKIAIDIRRMTEFGVGTYTRNVVRALGRLDHENEYFLIGSPQKVAEIGPLPPNFQTVPLLEPERTPAKGYLEFRAMLKRLNATWCISRNLFWMPRGSALSLCDDRARSAGAHVARTPAHQLLGARCIFS